MRRLQLAILCLLTVSAVASAAVGLGVLAERRRTLTSEFAVLQKALKDVKTPDQTRVVTAKLDDFCLRVNELRGSEYPRRGILGECCEYRSSYWGTTERALSAKVDGFYAELQAFPLPTAGNYDPQAINKIQRVLDKMNDLLMASERLRATRR